MKSKPKTIQKFANIIIRLDNVIISDETDYSTYTIDQIHKYVQFTIDEKYIGKTVHVTYIRYIMKSNGVVRYRGDDSFMMNIK